jgi:beta-glucanase (GH16 family)
MCRQASLSLLFLALGVIGCGSVSRSADTAADQTAASAFNWGDPIMIDEFDGSELGSHWNVYDSPGHAGNGLRSPDQAAVDDGLLTITGTAAGTTAGMAWQPGQMYGRWEVRMRAAAGCGCYHPVLILWPDANDFPVGGEVDFAEVFAADRQEVNFFLHFSERNDQIKATQEIDVTEWHNYAVEWTADHVTGFIDGRQWFTTGDAEKLPPRPMHLTIQLDWFPGDGDASEGATMEVDWVRIYE